MPAKTKKTKKRAAKPAHNLPATVFVRIEPATKNSTSYMDVAKDLETLGFYVYDGSPIGVYELKEVKKLKITQELV